MNIIEKLQMDYTGLVENGPINIVVFGDSVTHGAVGAGEIDYDTVYWNLLRKKLNAYRNYVPVNMINAGIGGITAERSLCRMERDVLSHHPDLVIVCFGLNDVNFPLEEFTQALDEIFDRLNNAGIPAIYMTPNMLNTYVDPRTEQGFCAYAAVTADFQNNGRMDAYMQAARQRAEGKGIPVCDCYAKWKQLQQQGEDITGMLANYINHPTREMHHLFADMLYRMIMDRSDAAKNQDSTMLHK